MPVKADEFFRAITNAQFDIFIEGREEEFKNYINEAISNSRSRIIVRFLFEVNETDVYVPYYIWAVYEVEDDELGALELFPPDFSDTTTYLQTPKELENEPYFEIAIEK